MSISSTCYARGWVGPPGVNFESFYILICTIFVIVQLTRVPAFSFRKHLQAVWDPWHAVLGLRLTWPRSCPSCGKVRVLLWGTPPCQDLFITLWWGLEIIWHASDGQERRLSIIELGLRLGFAFSRKLRTNSSRKTNKIIKTK
uniref:Uncharacterized protein n=1 Tax=Rhizoctonia solani TaxID=456999 RepID=N0A723_9AGAM|nr:hypothetical protein RSOL_m01250 [Rhizoctonia solani]AGK45437.1 hypothetical protein RSOL_m01250 [Rhizoctonia solani]